MHLKKGPKPLGIGAFPSYPSDAPTVVRALRIRKRGGSMPYWAAAQLQPQRDGLVAPCLRQAGFEIYVPRLREPRTAHGRKVVRTPLLFPGYLFVFIRLQWHTARWAPGVVRLVMNGTAPAAVPEGVIMALQARETDGLIDPQAPEIPHR